MPWSFNGKGSILSPEDEESVWYEEGYIPPGVSTGPNIPLWRSNYVHIDNMGLDLEDDE